MPSIHLMLDVVRTVEDIPEESCQPIERAGQWQALPVHVLRSAFTGPDYSQKAHQLHAFEVGLEKSGCPAWLDGDAEVSAGVLAVCNVDLSCHHGELLPELLGLGAVHDVDLGQAGADLPGSETGPCHQAIQSGAHHASDVQGGAGVVPKGHNSKSSGSGTLAPEPLDQQSKTDRQISLHRRWAYRAAPCRGRAAPMARPPAARDGS